ncbi:M20/M25/M40 family metallo-hydrolase [Roseococcus sp. SDR]|uniref:M20/M25/M40 family metallo-hydrolase n=1 Tax=Roseococcus sp. SDR TaxID=2835532 RepID=UPI001BD07A3F|nr:M20/M25/M40 family metallo-hydrolase [Roseococcus sp. SDR]MBS7789140.1 M20/M25/M40 family metallo-hydrolase [Roseococcus sp. SDR]MBV1844454.1 M20/M25/M40 family metallo-hydrolase [Roseococcus sp. SDR]
MTDIHRHAAGMQAALPEILAMAERCVNIDSGSYMAGGVNAVIDIWAGMLSGMGFSVERTPLPGFGDQMTARLALGGNGPRVLVLGHADTVWPEGIAAIWPFKREGDTLTGPGVGDMKTNVVMALHAIRMLLAEKALGHLASITVCIVPDEEIGSPGSRAWLEAESRNADLCLTLEPCRPNGGMVVGRGAVGAFYLNATGITAHVGSAREKGASALAALAALVEPLEALGDPANGLCATVGILRGGDARQVVPGSAEMHVDLRAPDDAAGEKLLAEVRAIAARPPRDSRVTITARGGFTRPAFPTHEGTRVLYAKAEEFCRALEIPVHQVVSRGGSDGSFSARLGVPTIDGLGPITHETCSRREWVEVPSIITRGAVLAGLMASAGR